MLTRLYSKFVSEKPLLPLGGMTIGTGTDLRSNSRSSKSSKYSASRARSSQHSSSIQGGGSTLGGQPLAGLPGGSNKSEIKHRFEITKKLGSGTYGKVSLAYDHKTEKEVAVKLIKKSAIENKQDLVRIRREIRIMSALKHPNIIQIFEVFENRDKIILVMEYASGGELYDYVSTYGSLPEPEARRIFRQITSAVLYCHKHKVVHRDLKLENILLDSDNNAKIADFGLSNYFSDKSLLSTFCGSPLYASPEIINGTPYRGPEVDCWSLGILLYTLVYGSMPFDGRDFNRMVRQIKRGAYFEPDTPSTASMLIRNMLRVNPERRADIDEIASHWWLNLDENMPVIQELPENQIVDHTPLTERAETMVVQDLADESDVFMDFGHLSASTRLKIEEFRRRRKEAEEYIENSPIKLKSRKTDGELLTAAEKSLRSDPRQKERERVNVEDTSGYADPLERLRRLESRLHSSNKENRAANLFGTAQSTKESLCSKALAADSVSKVSKQKKSERKSPEQPDDPVTSNSRIRIFSEKATRNETSTKKPSFVPLDSETTTYPKSYRKPSETWRMETDSLNMLMNQVLEQMEKGPVSLTLVARIKAHPFYDARPMVKELLESIIAAQPPSVQEQASKLIQQQSQELIKRQTQITGSKRGSTDATSSAMNKVDEKRLKHTAPDTTQRKNAQQKTVFEERPWHSVEVGFDPDEDTEHHEPSARQSIQTDNTEETVQDTSFEDVSDEEIVLNSVNTKQKSCSEGRAKGGASKNVQDDEQGVEESDSEIDELGKEVEQMEDEDNGSYKSALSSTEQAHEDANELNPPPDPQTKTSPQYADAFDRNLSKRQSKGKYQHSKVELYGRGVSMECESPTLPHRRIGGPQPTIETSPFLFDKAKKYIMTYPKQIDDSGDDIPGRLAKRNKKNWLRTQDPDVLASSGENQNFSNPSSASRVCSLPPRTPPSATKSEDEEASETESEEEEEDDDEEQSEEDSDQNCPNNASRKSGSGKTADDEQLGPNASKRKSESTSTEMEGNRARVFATVRQQNKSTTKPSSIINYRDEFVPNRLENGRITSVNTDGSVPKTAYVSQSPGSTLLDRGYPSETPYAQNRFLKDNSDITSTVQGGAAPPYYRAGGRLDDDHYRSVMDTDHASPARFNIGSGVASYMTQNDRRKSKSAHELTPDRPEIYSSGPAANKLDMPGSILAGRYDHESPHLQSWAVEPKRFYVYQTRAEREAEKNTAVGNLHPSSVYRIGGSAWRTGNTNSRPGSIYMADYKTRYDDGFPYRRNSAYDINISNLGQETTAANTKEQSHDQSSVTSARYRPLSKRIASTIAETTRRNYGRSHSMDRNTIRSDDIEYLADMRNRLMTPELNGAEKEYSYVNYHDTSAARGSTPHEPDHNKVPARGILKNKQSTESERFMADTTDNNRAFPGSKDSAPASSGVKHMFDRLKRHLSTEKSASPAPSGNVTQGLPYRNHYGTAKSTNADAVTHAPIAKSLDEGKLSKEEPSKAAKKRSLFMALGRRRTTEMRLGPDGKITIAGLETDLKRPSSPIEKIKSLFRKSKESVPTSSTTPQPTTGSYGYHDYVNYPSTRYGLTDKIYGVYPVSPHWSPSVGRDSFTPQYRKYAGTSGVYNVNYNRYSYTPGANAERTLRHWHDDPHLY